MRREIARSARVARRFASERLGDLADERASPVEEHPAARPRRRELREPGLDLRRSLRPDSRHAVELPGGGGLAQLGESADPERVSELAHPLRGDSEQRRDADQLRQRLRFELSQLGQLARLDELLQPGLDSGADAGELAGAPGADELRDVHGCRADQLGRPAVGAHGVVARPGEVEQRCEGLQSFGECGVLHV